MDINDHFKAIYKQNKLNENELSGKVTNPLLISIPSDCFEMPKIMLFGQETNGWHGNYERDKSVECEMEAYHRFWFEKKSQYSKKGTLMQTFGELQKTFPNICFVWNNVIKVGKMGKGTPSDTMIEWQRNWFDVIKKEIDCLQPTMMFFFSGPNYDKFIQKSLGEFKIENIGEEPIRQIAKLNFVDYPHIQAYRTYHPIYLRRSHLIKAYMKIIDESIRNQFEIM